MLKQSLTFLSLIFWLMPAQGDNIHTKYIQDGKQHPLVVILGGSEGGNYFSSPHMQSSLQNLNDKGLSVASIAYFDNPGTPDKLERLALEEVQTYIDKAKSAPEINAQCVALLGISRGSELSLLLSSHFDDYQAVVAAYPSHVSWNSHTYGMSSSASWTFDGQDIPYLEAPYLSFNMLKGIFTGYYVDAFYAGLNRANNLEQASIKVEDINAQLMFVSAEYDEIWPSYYMANQLIKRLDNKRPTHNARHISLRAGHLSLNQAWEPIGDFLAQSLAQCKASS